MNIQQHQRIARIKVLSRCLYLALTGMQYLLWVLWPLMLAWPWFGTTGEIKLVDRAFDSASLSFLQRCLIALFISAFLLLLLKVIYHLRQLILHFASGDIFNKKATGHARKALHIALLIYGIYVISTLGMWAYIYIKNQYFPVSFNGNFIFGMIIFGLMYVLLWALEIGCDLNEESELTI